jgi:sugar lactone lactonase YvrE
VETFGETGQPYIVDSDHLNGVNGISLDGADNLWIAEWFGGEARKYNSSGTFQMSIDDRGPAGELGPLGDVAVGPGGTVWIADTHKHRVVQFSQTGEYVSHLGVEWEPGSDNDHFDSPLGVAFDSHDNLYVSDSGNHRVQVFDSTGTYSTTLGVTGEARDDNGYFAFPDCLFVDDEDTLYVADTDNHRVQIYDHSGAYSATLGVPGAAGWDNAHLDEPSDVAVDGRGHIYVADTNNSRIQIFDTGLNYVDTLGETGVSGSDDDHFKWPEGVAVDSEGKVYVSDWGNFRVLKFSSELQHLDTIGTTGVPYRTDEDHFNYPADVAADDAGHLFVVEANGHRLLKLDSDGGLEAAVGTPGIAGSGHHLFSAPSGVSLDSDGRVYVADRDNHRVQVFDRDLQYMDTVGTGSCDTGSNALCSPDDVAVDATGNVYVADTGNERVQVFDSSYEYMATLGVTGLAGSDDDHFRRPRGVAVDRRGNVYVADEENARVQTCTVTGSTGNCSTFAGETGVFGYDFGHLRAPLDVAVDDESRVYVCDGYWNQRIQVFDERGAYLTTVGGEWGGYNGEFRNPEGIDVDRRGSLYVADTENTRVQHYTAGVSGWKQVNINGFGDPEQSVNALAAFGDGLYAGTWHYSEGRAEVWRASDGDNWSRFTPSWTISNTVVFDVEAFEGQLYVGTACDDGAEIWRTDGADWEQVVWGGFGDGNNGGVNVFAVFSNMIYAATTNDTSGVEIWRSATGDPGSWSQVNGDGFGSSGTAQDVTMELYDNALYVGLGRGDPPVAELWRTENGTTWTAMFEDGLGDSNNTHVSAMSAFRGDFYLGLRNVNEGGQIWRCDDGANWSQVFAGGLGDATNKRPYGLIKFNEHLYLVFTNWDKGAEVWKTADGDSWRRMVDGGWGDSNNQGADYFDKGAAIFENRLYIGTHNSASGGEIWREASCAVYLPLTLRSFSSVTSPYEPNDTPSQAHGPIGPSVIYQAYPDDTEDWYFFNLPGARDVTVEVSDFTGGDGRLMVYAAEDTDITVPDGDDSSGGPTMTVTPSDLPSGKYYIRVYTGGSTNVTTLYNLTVSY